MTRCPACNMDDACILITTVLCCNTVCQHYDAAWAEEVLTSELEAAYAAHDVKRAAKKLKSFSSGQSPW